MVERNSDRKRGIVVGIDASRNRSGGAKSHLIGLITGCDPADYGVREVHVWAYRTLLDGIPDRPWLVKHNPKALECSLVRQVLWQVFSFPTQIQNVGCDIVLNTDAGSMSSVEPSVTMSRDMLSYEPGEIDRYGWSKARLRLIVLRFVQNRSLRRADGAIFLTDHAARVIQKHCGVLRRTAHIPHGVGENFLRICHTLQWPDKQERAIRLLYISNTALYKHQWTVVKAVEQLRGQGFNVSLKLVGGGQGPAQRKLLEQMAVSDPRGEYISQEKFVPQDALPRYLSESDVFVFASSCENMPNTLIEAMAAGLPVVCSRRGPMPEVLEDAGEYFDPEESQSIAEAIRKVLDNREIRSRMSARAKALASQYSWERCARETWLFLVDTFNNYHGLKR